MPHPRRLPLATVYNMRDLGGFAAAAGVTAFGRLWRSDLLGELPEGDVAAIERAGVRTVIDLRGDDERARVPNSLNGRPGITYVGLPLLGDVDTLAARMGMPLHDSFMHSLSILYSTMADSNPDCFVQVFEALLSGLVRGGVVFHCTAGKDRTGVIAAMVLELCGVARADIVADYAVTEIHLRPFPRPPTCAPSRSCAARPRPSSTFSTTWATPMGALRPIFPALVFRKKRRGG